MSDRKRRCSYCGAMHLCRKPARRRPTDSERLTWLLKFQNEVIYAYDSDGTAWALRKRAHIDRLMREEARRAR